MLGQKQAQAFKAVISPWKDFKDQQDNRTDAEIAGFIWFYNSLLSLYDL